jgi:signal transduction histidine kinase
LLFFSIGNVVSQDNISESDTSFINHAELVSLKGHREVELPHILTEDDFSPKGSLVRYRSDVYLAFEPKASIGIFVGKVSLSARFYVNGQYAGACELGALEKIRCLQKPNLFVIPPIFWHVGHNQLEFEIFANNRQTNGLSAIQIGDIETLAIDQYRPRFWWQVSLVEHLMWISLSFGILGLLVGLALKQDSVYVWFGLTSISNASSCLVSITSQPLIDIEWFSWLVFASRFVSVVLFLVMLLAFFNKTKLWIKRIVISYAIAGPVLIWLTDNSREVVMALYIPCLIIGVIMPVIMAYWSNQTHKLSQITLTFAVSLIMIASIFDWARLSGTSAFEGVYFIQYAYSGTLIVIGGLLIQFLVNSLIESRELSQTLEVQVANRTADLEKMHQHLLLVETEQSRNQERERLMRDMHDGFGSQLITARLMTEQGQISQTQLGQIIDECIADLYLVIDSLASDTVSLESALANFRYRIEQRLTANPIDLHWRFQFGAEVPTVPQQSVLQILRILQEALNNIYKHANADNIWFNFRYQAETGELKLRVMDDGIGLSSTTPPTGCGLNNMAKRARDIGAELTVRNRHLNLGTLVDLTMFIKPDRNGEN